MIVFDGSSGIRKTMESSKPELPPDVTDLSVNGSVRPKRILRPVNRLA